MKFPRWQLAVIKSRMAVRRVILLLGPRQSGKSTIAKELAEADEDIEYRNLDDPATLNDADTDQRSFVMHNQRMLIIDEVHRVPNLVRYVKLQVDEDNTPGRYLLTGSADVTGLPQVAESLAGRVAEIRLRPLTQGEILLAAPSFIKRCFEQDFKSRSEVDCSFEKILPLALRGGFPEVLELTEAERFKWHTDYVKVMLARDLQEIANIQRAGELRKILQVVAAWSAKGLNMSQIGAKLKMHRQTMASYLNYLEALFMVDFVPSWGKTQHSKVMKRDKLFMSDSGLMASLLGITTEKLHHSPDLAGAVMETFTCNELLAQVDASDYEYDLYHFEYNSQREIDFILEDHTGALVGIEVKAHSRFDTSDFRHLKWFRQNLASGRPFVGIVLYTGNRVLNFSDNLWLIPFTELWSDR